MWKGRMSESCAKISIKAQQVKDNAEEVRAFIEAKRKSLKENYIKESIFYTDFLGRSKARSIEAAREYVEKHPMVPTPSNYDKRTVEHPYLSFGKKYYELSEQYIKIADFSLTHSEYQEILVSEDYVDMMNFMYKYKPRRK